MKWKALFGRSLLLFGSLAVAFSVGELFFRHRFRAWPFEQPLKHLDHLTEKDTALRWRFSPEDGRNELGLKNRPITPKDPHTFRILLLGDSLIWTGETSGGALYSQVVESNLNALARARARRCEVINAGVPGYTTWQELEFLRQYGLSMQPDLVVLGFVYNDVFCPYLHRPVEGNLLAWEPTARLNRFDTSRFPGLLFQKSYLAHELARVFRKAARLLRREPTFQFDAKDDFYLAWFDYAWPQTAGLLRQMRDLLAEHGIPLQVMVFPVSEQLDDRALKLDRRRALFPERKIGAICAELDLPLLNYREALYAAGGTNLYADYLHLNRAGNDVIAAELTRFLAPRIDLGIAAP